MDRACTSWARFAATTICSSKGVSKGALRRTGRPHDRPTQPDRRGHWRKDRHHPRGCAWDDRRGGTHQHCRVSLGDGDPHGESRHHRRRCPGHWSNRHESPHHRHQGGAIQGETGTRATVARCLAGRDGPRESRLGGGTDTGGSPRWGRTCALRGGASHEAKGLRGAAVRGRVGPPATRRRLCVLRQIGDKLVPGVEQFLLVDDVVASKMARLLWPVRSMATRSGTLARIRLRAAVRRQSWRKRVGTPAA